MKKAETTISKPIMALRSSLEADWILADSPRLVKYVYPAEISLTKKNNPAPMMAKVRRRETTSPARVS